jgi:hypothetical protein
VVAVNMREARKTKGQPPRPITGSLQQCIFAVDHGWAEYAYDEIISTSLDVPPVGAWAESISIALVQTVSMFAVGAEGVALVFAGVDVFIPSLAVFGSNSSGRTWSRRLDSHSSPDTADL